MTQHKSQKNKKKCTKCTKNQLKKVKHLTQIQKDLKKANPTTHSKYKTKTQIKNKIISSNYKKLNNKKTAILKILFPLPQPKKNNKTIS